MHPNQDASPTLATLRAELSCPPSAAILAAVDVAAAHNAANSILSLITGIQKRQSRLETLAAGPLANLAKQSGAIGMLGRPARGQTEAISRLIVPSIAAQARIQKIGIAASMADSMPIMKMGQQNARLVAASITALNRNSTALAAAGKVSALMDSHRPMFIPALEVAQTSGVSSMLAMQTSRSFMTISAGNSVRRSMLRDLADVERWTARDVEMVDPPPAYVAEVVARSAELAPALDANAEIVELLREAVDLLHEMAQGARSGDEQRSDGTVTADLVTFVTVATFANGGLASESLVQTLTSSGIGLGAVLAARRGARWIRERRNRG